MACRQHTQWMDGRHTCPSSNRLFSLALCCYPWMSTIVTVYSSPRLSLGVSHDTVAPAWVSS